MRNLELFTMASPEHFEPLSRMEIDPVYRTIVDRFVPTGWQRKAFDIWYFCQPHLESLVQQGFKIHLSATRRNAEELLNIVIPECVTRNLPFKTVADPRLLSLTNSKNFDRGSSGKFIVIYPPDMEVFRETLARLDEATRNHTGPYILSDRRYGDSKVLHYRFGGFWPMHRVEADGRRVPCIQSPSGELEADERLPYFQLPDWVEDPFPTVAEEAPPDGLLNSRYRVEEAIAFSNGGGVYLAIDTTTGAKVVIKEARPLSNFWMARPDSPDYIDATKILEREFCAIKKLEGLPFVVRGVEIFKEWEHHFLVEEFVEGQSLSKFRARDDFIVIALHGGEDQVQRFCEKFRKIALQLIDIALAVHSRRILLVDVSANNFLVDPETLAVTLIDLETSIDLDIPRTGDDIVRVWTTPGARRPGLDQRREYLPEDDLYALGMVLYSLLVPIQTLFEIQPDAVEPFIDDIARGVGLPPEVKDTIFLLLAGKALEAREVLDGWDPRESRTAQSSAAPDARPWERWRETDRQRIGGRIRQALDGIASYLGATFDPRRDDRLWPADVRVFDTNPLSVACGACGPLLFLKDMGRTIPESVREWVGRQEFREDAYPPGLYWGLAGVGCALAELGFEEKAREAMQRANASPIRFDRADMWYGAAGLGWANLSFYGKDREAAFLDHAREAGNALLSTAVTRDGGCCWPNPMDGKVHYGFAYGASGICLFLLQLHAATGEETFRNLGRRGLDFELASALEDSGVIRWFNHEDARGVCEPYWEHGNAGVGSALLRCAALLDDDSLRVAAEKAEKYAFCKWAVLPSQFSGLSGIGEFMLDLHLFTGRESYLNKAYAVADTILHYAVERPEGIAFPGRLLLRLSNDFSTGAAGVGTFLHRLLHPGHRRFVDLDPFGASRFAPTVPESVGDLSLSTP